MSRENKGCALLCYLPQFHLISSTFPMVSILSWISLIGPSVFLNLPSIDPIFPYLSTPILSYLSVLYIHTVHVIHMYILHTWCMYYIGMARSQKTQYFCNSFPVFSRVSQRYGIIQCKSLIGLPQHIGLWLHMFRGLGFGRHGQHPSSRVHCRCLAGHEFGMGWIRKRRPRSIPDPNPDPDGCGQTSSNWQEGSGKRSREREKESKGINCRCRMAYIFWEQTRIPRIRSGVERFDTTRATETQCFLVADAARTLVEKVLNRPWCQCVALNVFGKACPANSTRDVQGWRLIQDYTSTICRFASRAGGESNNTGLWISNPTAAQSSGAGDESVRPARKLQQCHLA